MSIDKHEFEQIQKKMLEMQQTDIKTETKTEVKTEQPVPVEVAATEVKAEQPVQRNVEATTQMTIQAQQQLPAVAVNRTAAGQPVQHEEAPKFSWKKWKRDRQKADIARENGCQVATAISYDLVQQLKVHERRKNNVANAYKEQCENAKLDGRLMLCFCRGFELDAQGQPLTEEDVKNKHLDDVFCAEYCSNRLEYRVPHLNRMVQEVFSIPITEDILSEENLRSRAIELDHWGEIATYMDNVMKDDINKPYFDEMDPQKKDELLERMAALSRFSTAYTSIVGIHGVKRSGVYRKDVDEDIRRALQEKLAGDEGKYQENRKALQEKWKEQENTRKTFLRNEIFRTHAKALKEIGKLPKDQIEEAAENHKWKTWMKNEIFARLKAEMDMTEAEKNGVYMERAAVLMKEGSAYEEENKQTLRILKEMQRCGTEIAPSADLYLQAKDLVKPRVDKVLDLDIEKWKKMSEKELVSHMEELNELFLDGTFVTDLMQLKHPHQTNIWGTAPITLKEELVGQRGPEYSMKISVLRALAEKARTLAILAKAENTGKFEDVDYTNAELREMQGGKEAFLNRKLEAAANLLHTSEEKYHRTYTPGTQEFQNYINYLNDNKPVSLVVDDIRYHAVCMEFQEKQTAEAAQAMKRLKENYYYTLRYSEAELKAKGMKPNIKEAIFRSFRSFLGMEATRKLLTPEAFRQMLLDLGAGGGLHNGEWSVVDGEKLIINPGSPQEEVEEAIRLNNRGLETYKKVVSAQMDMVARKYGGKLEKMKIHESLEHCIEIAKDCMDGQVMMNMCGTHPDMFDLQSSDVNYFSEEHPAEDKLLLARVMYYNLMLKVYSDLVPFLKAGEIKNEAEAREFIVNSFRKSKDYTVSKAYLEKNDPLFKKMGDWSQKVEAPAE